MIKKWDKIVINTKDGKKETLAPVIISASRVTDIPAFFSEWFINRLKEGYLKWKNPFSQKEYYISFEKTRLIVFWSKNPEPLIKYLDYIDKKSINYYFTYTLNDYEKEKLEPNIPPLKERINTFKVLSSKIGKERVIWRFDPLILSDKITIDELIYRIQNIGNKIHKYTEKLVISFVDMKYKKVKINLGKLKEKYREFTDKEKFEFAKKISYLSKNWGIKVATCAEKLDLEKYGIIHNRCIDPYLMIRVFRNDNKLMQFLGVENNLFENIEEISEITGNKLKDKGQRKNCGCIVSKDIGSYNTCMHLCKYCYANFSGNVVKENFKKHKINFEGIIK